MDERIQFNTGDEQMGYDYFTVINAMWVAITVGTVALVYVTGKRKVIKRS